MTDTLSLQCARCGDPLAEADDQRGFYCSLYCALEDIPDLV